MVFKRGYYSDVAPRPKKCPTIKSIYIPSDRLIPHGEFLSRNFESSNFKISLDWTFPTFQKCKFKKNTYKLFLRNWPIVHIFHDFWKKLTIFSRLFKHFMQSFDPQWPYMSQKIFLVMNFALTSMGQNMIFLTNFFFLQKTKFSLFLIEFYYILMFFINSD